MNVLNNKCSKAQKSVVLANAGMAISTALNINIKDGIEKECEEESFSQEMTAKDLLSKKVFWIISLAFAFQFLSMMGVLSFLPIHASKMGLDQTWILLGLPVKQYVFAYALSAFGGVLGKITFGYLIDIMKAAYPSMIAMFLQAIGILSLIHI